MYSILKVDDQLYRIEAISKNYDLVFYPYERILMHQLLNNDKKSAICFVTFTIENSMKPGWKCLLFLLI